MGQIISSFLWQEEEEEEKEEKEQEEEEEEEEKEEEDEQPLERVDKKSLILKNIPCETTSDYLEYYIDKISGFYLSAKRDYEVISKTECCYIVHFKSSGKHVCN